MRDYAQILSTSRITDVCALACNNMFNSVLLSLNFLFLCSPLITSAINPMKRLYSGFSTIEDWCQADAVDCGGGFCCYVNEECVKASPEPFCLAQHREYVPGLSLSCFVNYVVSASPNLVVYSNTVLIAFPPHTPQYPTALSVNTMHQSLQPGCHTHA